MAMNKAERRELESLKKELLRARAWRLTQPVDCDIAIPTYTEGLVKGWSLNAYSDRVDVSCSTSIHHSVWKNDETRSQGAISQYSTKLRALHALRYEVEQLCIDRLVKIDQMIAEEESQSYPPMGPMKGEKWQQTLASRRF